MKKFSFLLSMSLVLLSGCIQERDSEATLYDITVEALRYGTARAEVTEAPKGDTVMLTATPNAGYVFDRWRAINGNVVFENALVPSTTFIMPSSNVRIEAEFVEAEAVKYRVKVTAVGNGSVRSDLSEAIAGTTITLTATPGAGYGLVGWTVIGGGISLDDPTANPLSFTMPNANVELRAEFAEMTLYNIRVSVPDGNGAIVPSVMEAPEGATVTLTAVPYADYGFAGWTSVGGEIAFEDAMANPVRFKMPAADVEIRGAFRLDVFAVIEDAAFREFCHNASHGDNIPYDADSDGILSPEEAAAVTTMDVSDMEITSLAGIEYFTGLTVLDCSENPLRELNLSRNTALVELNCAGSADNGTRTLQSLDIRNLEALAILDCSVNLLGTLDLQSNRALTSLDCSANLLYTLNLQGKTRITNLDCSNNELTDLNLVNNTNIVRLNCGSNNITHLDLSPLTKAEFIECNSGKLASLTAPKNNTSLTDLDCSYNRLTMLDVTGSVGLEFLQCYNNDLTRVDLSKNTVLTTLQCNNNRLVALDLSQNVELSSLSCGTNQIASLDLSQNPALEELLAGNNKLASVDLSGNTTVLRLTLDHNELTDVDFSDNSALENLYIDNNLLTSLDVSANTALYQINCAENQLTSFKASSALTYLDCNGNLLAELDITPYTKLWHLACHDNKMTEFDATPLYYIEFDKSWDLLCGMQTDIEGKDQYLTLTLRDDQMSYWESMLEYRSENAHVTVAE